LVELGALPFPEFEGSMFFQRLTIILIDCELKMNKKRPSWVKQLDTKASLLIKNKTVIAINFISRLAFILTKLKQDWTRIIFIARIRVFVQGLTY
jgi:hypothetical protein